MDCCTEGEVRRHIVYGMHGTGRIRWECYSDESLATGRFVAH